MSWSMAAVAGVSIGSSLLASNATKKQAKIQADAIREGGAIDQAARNRAISQVLGIFGPSLVQFNESMQSSIDLLSQGRISTGDLLTQSANNVSEITRKGGQSALNALLGLPSPENVTTPQQANSSMPQGNGNQPQVGQPSSTVSPTGIGTNPQAQPQMNIQPDGSIRLGNDQMQMIPGGTQQQGTAQQQGGTQRIGEQLLNQQPFGAYQNMGPFLSEDPRANFPANYDPSAGWQSQEQIQDKALNAAISSTTPLEGEFIPRDYGFNQQILGMPQGTNAGLIGAEQAVQSGADLGRQDLASGAAGALESLGTQTGIARDDIGQGRNFALSKIQQSIQAGRNGINQGVNSINQGAQQGVNAINQGIGQATGYLQPYMAAGQEALNPLMALSGVRGQEAFDAALINDPAYNYALKNSETALSRNAGVTGGIGSGNTKDRFQRNAQDYGASNIDNQLNRFRSITDAGQRAAGTAGGFATQGGIASGGILNQAGANAGNLQARGGELEASQLNRMGDVGIQSSQQLAQLAQQLGMSESQLLQSLGGNLANIDVNTGQQIGGMREAAGINASNILQNTANQQGGIDSGLAQQLAGLDQETLNNIINSMQGGAGTNLQSNQQLATLLANLGIGAGSSAQQTAIGIGQAQAGGVTNPIGNALNTGIGLYTGGAFNQPSPYAPPPATSYAPSPTRAYSTGNLNLSQQPLGINTSGYQGTIYNPQVLM